MNDLIKRSDAIKAIEDLPNAYNGWSDTYDKAYIIGTLEEVPSADRPSIDIVRCAECHWARPRTLKGETGYRCLFYRVDKAEDGYCDNGERSE